MPKKPSMSDWVEQLQSRGCYTFTRSKAESETGRSSVAVQTALRRLKGRVRIVSPRRGFYAIVPPEYRATGSPPASWFIDDLMRHLDQPYYVGILSAAAIHGAAHQQPMVFQVMTDKPTREMRAGKVTIQFSMSSKIEQMPTTGIQTETGTMRVATPETTAFDLVRYQAAAGHLSNIATVLVELSEHIDGQALVKIAHLVKIPDVQRLGYLLDAVGESDLAGPLPEWLKARKPRVVPLLPGAPAKGEIDERWHTSESTPNWRSTCIDHLNVTNTTQTKHTPKMATTCPKHPLVLDNYPIFQEEPRRPAHHVFPARAKTVKDSPQNLNISRSVNSIDTLHQKPHNSPVRANQQENAMVTTTPIQTATDLGKAIRMQRKSDNLTLADVAGLTNVGVRFLSELENGKPTVRLDKLLRVVNALGLELYLTSP